MVSVEGGAPARRRVPLGELVYESAEENRRVAGVLERLTTARLVVPDQDADGQAVVEPAHDALVNGWDRLLRWTGEDQEQLTLRRHLTPAANAWKAGSGGLWSADRRLPELVRLAGRDGGWLNKDEREFVRRSGARRRLARGAIACGLSILFGVGALAYVLDKERALANANSANANLIAKNEEKERKRQEGEARLARNLNANRTFTEYFEAGDLESGFKYLVRALRTDSGNQFARDRLISMLVHRPRTEVAWEAKPGGAATVNGLKLAPDGASFVYRTANGRAGLHGADGRAVALGSEGESVRAIGYSPGGTELIGVTDQRLAVWEVATGAVRFAAPVEGGVCFDVTDDARLAAVGCRDGKKGKIRFVPLTDWTATPAEIERPTPALDVRFAQKASRLYVCEPDRIAVIDIQTRSVVGSSQGRRSFADIGGNGDRHAITRSGWWCYSSWDSGAQHQDLPKSEIHVFHSPPVGDGEKERSYTGLPSFHVVNISLCEDGTVAAAFSDPDEVRIFRGQDGDRGGVVLSFPGVIGAALGQTGAPVVVYGNDPGTGKGLLQVYGPTGMPRSMPHRFPTGILSVDVTSDSSRAAVLLGDARVVVVGLPLGDPGLLASDPATRPDRESFAQREAEGGRVVLRRRGSGSDDLGHWTVTDSGTTRVQISMPPNGGNDSDETASADISGDGRFVVTSAGPEPPPAVWDAMSGKRLGDTAAVTKSAFVKRVFISKASGLVVLDTYPERRWDESRLFYFPLGTDPSGAGSADLERRERLLDVSPDGELLSVATPSGVYFRKLRDPTDRTAVFRYGGGQVFGGRFAPDGRSCVVTAFDGTARVLDPASGLPVSEPLVYDTDPWANVRYETDLEEILVNMEYPPKYVDGGRRVLFITARERKLPPVVADMCYALNEDDVRQLVELAVAWYGYELDAGQSVKPASTPAQRILRQRFPVASGSDQRDIDRITRWLFAEPGSRAATPLSER
jgi:hypothetical protein